MSQAHSINKVSLSDVDANLINTIFRYVYMTQAQLVNATNYNQSHVSKRLQNFIASGLVDTFEEVYPHVVYRLGAAAYRFFDLAGYYRSRWHSPTMIQHFLHKNESIFSLKKSFDSIKMVPRKTVGRIGLNPSIGEHPIMIDNQLVLMMVDDYGFSTSRLIRSWTRKHKADRRYFSAVNIAKEGGSVHNRWCDNAKKIILVTFDEFAERKHSRWLNKNNELLSELELNVELFKAKRLWSIS